MHAVTRIRTMPAISQPQPSVCSLTAPTTGSRKAEIAVDSDKIVCARMSYEQRLQRAMEASMVTGATASAAANPTLTKQVSLSSHCWQRLEVFLNEGVGRGGNDPNQGG